MANDRVHLGVEIVESPPKKRQVMSEEHRLLIRPYVLANMPPARIENVLMNEQIRAGNYVAGISMPSSNSIRNYAINAQKARNGAPNVINEVERKLAEMVFDVADLREFVPFTTNSHVDMACWSHLHISL